MKDRPAVLPSPSLCFANRIRQARIRAGLTKAELARRVGVCLSAAVQWEHPDGTVPNATNLARAAQVLDVAFEWLATGPGAPACPHPTDLPRSSPPRSHRPSSKNVCCRSRGVCRAISMNRCSSFFWR